MYTRSLPQRILLYIKLVAFYFALMMYLIQNCSQKKLHFNQNRMEMFKNQYLTYF